MMERPVVSLANLGHGAAVELFDDAMQKVLANISDPNTAVNVAREVTLKVKLVSDERDLAMVEMQAVPKLAPVMPAAAKILIGRATGGGVEAREYVSPQTELFGDAPGQKVYEIGKGGSGK